MFLTDKSRRLGDLAAGTIVVHERSSDALMDTRSMRQSALSTVVAYGEVPEGFPLEKLTERDLQMIEDYLLRRHQLPNRLELARHILSSLSIRLGLPANPVPERQADDVLAAIYKAAKSRFES